MTISYTPTFHHTDWVDNVDRVQAGGPNGFNTRFEAIESDLHGVSTTVGQIDTALSALSASPPPLATLLTLAPLFALAPDGAGAGVGWRIDQTGIATYLQGPTSAVGLLNVPVPDGVTLTSLRALGQNTGTNVISRVSLLRAPLLGIGTMPDRLAQVAVDANPYDHTIAVNAAMATVDLSTYRYFVLATADNAAAGDVVTINAIQVGYLGH